MEYVYAALLLHESGQEIEEDRLTAVLEAGGIEVDSARVKATVAALGEIDIEDALQTTAVPAAAPSPAGGEAAEPEAGEAAETEAEEEEEPEEEEDEAAAEGLGDLFG